MAKSARTSRPIPLVALVLAWLVPGAGHAYLGRLRRGAIIFVTVSATFWTGVAIGGVMTVDYHNERWWFAAEMLSGIHGLIGWHRQQKVYEELTANPLVGDAPPPGASDRTAWNARIDGALAKEGLALEAPLDTVARAYAGVAGLVNLMCVFDAVMLALLGVTGEPAPTRREQDEAPPQEQRP